MRDAPSHLDPAPTRSRRSQLHLPRGGVKLSRNVPAGLVLLFLALVNPSTGRATRGPNCAVNNVAPGSVRGVGLLSRLRGAGEANGGHMKDLAMMGDRQGFDIGASLGGEAAPQSLFHPGDTTAEEDRVARATKVNVPSSRLLALSTITSETTHFSRPTRAHQGRKTSSPSVDSVSQAR